MKTFLKRMIIAAGWTLGANALLAASLANDWTEQYFKAKTGRYTPAEEARQRDARANVAFREDALSVAAPSWFEQYYKAKVGRFTQAEEARLEQLKANSAYREEPPVGFIAPTWAEQLFKTKLGRAMPGK